MATIDERLEALTRNLELLEMELTEFKNLMFPAVHALMQSTQNLLKTATIHEQRLERLEGRGE